MTRLDDLRRTMTDTDTDMVVLAPGAHMEWLLGFQPHGDERPLLLCVTQAQAAFLMPALEAQSARQHTNLPFHTWDDAEGPGRAFDDTLVAVGGGDARTIVLDETMRADFAALVQDALPGAARHFTETTIGALRMRKDAGEYDRLKASALRADQGMQAAWAAMRPGMTELEVQEVVSTHFQDHGARIAFCILGTGANGAFPHHQTGQTKLAMGDAVVMDLGCMRDGAPSDMTRMAVVGHKPDGYDEIHGIVERAVQAALAAAKPGARAHEVDDAARGVIADAGYGDYFTHRTGHGLGVEIHEPPYITATAQTVLDEGMAFSIEPGIYLPGRFGVRLEDIVILRKDGPEILSGLPRDVVTVWG